MAPFEDEDPARRTATNESLARPVVTVRPCPAAGPGSRRAEGTPSRLHRRGASRCSRCAYIASRTVGPLAVADVREQAWIARSPGEWSPSESACRPGPCRSSAPARAVNYLLGVAGLHHCLWPSPGSCEFRPCSISEHARFSHRAPGRCPKSSGPSLLWPRTSRWAHWRTRGLRAARRCRAPMFCFLNQLRGLSPKLDI